MADQDTVKTAIEVAAILGAAKRAEMFLAAVAGKSGKDLTTIFGEWMHDRIANVQSIVGGSHLTLLNLDQSPREIPFNFLYPAIEAASVQDDPSLQQTWGNLFAHAADPRQETPVGIEACIYAERLGTAGS